MCQFFRISNSSMFHPVTSFHRGWRLLLPPYMINHDDNNNKGAANSLHVNNNFSCLFVYLKSSFIIWIHFLPTPNFFRENSENGSDFISTKWHLDFSSHTILYVDFGFFFDFFFLNTMSLKDIDDYGSKWLLVEMAMVLNSE